MKKGFLIILFLFPVLFAYPGVSVLLVKDTLVKIPADNCCSQEDVIDLFFRGNNPFRSTTPHRFRAFAIPLVAYDPATSLQVGLGGSFSLQLGNPGNTKISAGMCSVLFTLRQQFFIQFKSNVFFPLNDWLLQSDWRFYLFNLPSYALGTQNQCLIPDPGGYTTVTIDPSLDGTYLLGYDWIKFHNILSHKITRNLYAGVGYHFDYHYNIDDFELLVTGNSLLNTPHYAYSIRHGFNPSQYISSGVSANLVFDTRDDMVNAYSGNYININYRQNLQWIGSSRNGSELWAEYRTYIGLSKRCPRHLLAFWFFGSFIMSGDIPYLDLMSISYDQMNSSGRGYSQGRYRGEDYVYGEMEYRFPISPRTHILGGVIFTNVSTVSNRDMHIPVFGYFQPAAGVGLRIMVGKHDRTNIAIDFGFGNNSK